VTLTADSAVGYFFKGWESFEIASSAAAAKVKGNTVEITMRTDIDVYARFEPLAEPPAPEPQPSGANWRLYILVGPDGGGNVDPYSPQGHLMYPNGSNVNIQAWPVANYEFVCWEIQKLDANGNVMESVDIRPEEHTIPIEHTITMTSDVRVIAHFTRR
jgi:hypothetical protein